MSPESKRILREIRERLKWEKDPERPELLLAHKRRFEAIRRASNARVGR
jgi:hypothetical protein